MVLEKVETSQTSGADDLEKPVPQYTSTDYSGAHEKTDPKEIALVRKLDKWIMVRESTINGQALVMLT